MSRPSTYQRVLAVLGLFSLLAGDFWRYTLHYAGWAVLVGILLIAVVVELVRRRRELRRPPLTLLAFVLLAALSTIWSFYPGGTALGTLITVATGAFGYYLASLFDWEGMLRALGTALRLVIGGSLVFELAVAVVIRERILPFWTDYSDLDRIPNAFYWSRNLLFEGGRIQGIVGNANLLGMAALVGLIVFASQLLSRERRAGSGRVGDALWIAAALVTLALTRSSTVLVAALVVAYVVVVLLVMRGRSLRARRAISAGALGLAAVAGAAAVLLRDLLLPLVGRSPDLTDRVDIWAEVLGRAAERPAGGWGWIGYWQPWVEPFDDLVVIDGIAYFQAHSAWVDIAFQLGIVGLVVFGVLALTTAWRTAVLAGEAVSSARVWPFLLIVALLVQSLAESRLLVEFGWAALVALSVGSARLEEDAASGARAPRQGARA